MDITYTEYLAVSFGVERWNALSVDFKSLDEEEVDAWCKERNQRFIDLFGKVKVKNVYKTVAVEHNVEGTVSWLNP